MRIKQIGLSWFRGAGKLAELNLERGSLVVYGPNGAGKSTFVDALEYAIKEGRIDHLAHEYSGNAKKGVF